MSESPNGHAHVASKGMYYGIFGALMVLTFLTVAVSRIDLGSANILIALAIALVKGSLVVLYFMHVRHSSALVKLTAATGFLWLIFMFVITFADYLSRSSEFNPQSWIGG
jgi:cytochrome c oxidase subunit 4